MLNANDLIAVAKRDNDVLGGLAHLAYKTRGKGALVLTETDSTDALLPNLTIDYQTLSDEQMKELPYDPLLQYLLMSIDPATHEYVLARHDEPSPSPYELYRQADATLDRHLSGLPDLEALLNAHETWMASFAWRAYAHFGRGVFMVTSSATSEQLERQEAPKEIDDFSTRINDHACLIYMTTDSFLAYLTDIRERPENAEVLLMQTATYDPLSEYLIGLDDGNKTIYTSHRPTDVQRLPKRPVASPDDPTRLNRLVQEHFQRLFIFASNAHSRYDRGLICVTAAASPVDPDLPGGLLDDAGQWRFTYYPADVYDVSPLRTMGSLGMLRKLLMYDPRREILALVQSNDDTRLHHFRARQDAAFPSMASPDTARLDAIRQKVAAACERLAAAAFRGYQVLGRGAMLVMPTSSDGHMITVSPARDFLSLPDDQEAVYVPMATAKGMMQGDKPSWSYDPDQETVVIYIEPSGVFTVERVRLDVSPRRAYQSHKAEADALYA